MSAPLRLAAFALAAAVAWPGSAGAAAEPDSTIRLPGSPVRLGWNLERLGTLGSFHLLRGSGGSSTREGQTRWFGADAGTQATFQDGQMVKLRLSIDPAPPHLVDYALGTLRREGYRRVAWTPSGGGGESEWLGRTRVRVTSARARLVAEFEPVAPTAPPPPAPAAPPDTLDFLRTEIADALPAPVRAATPSAPERPAAAIEAGVFGRVLVCVTVDTSGTVVGTHVLRGVASLEPAALAWAREVRFEPYHHRGTATPFRVGVPVLFVPATEGQKP